MPDSPDPHTARLPHVCKLPEVQGFLFTLDDASEPLPGLADFFPEVVPIGEVAHLDFERSRRRFSEGA